MAHRGQSLAGRVALVTGAAGGLGHAFCLALGQAGASVVLAGRTAASLEAAVVALEQQGCTAMAAPLDVTRPESVADAFAHAQGAFGVVDIVVANAGIAVTRPALELSHDDWLRVLDVNLTGSWLVCREAASRLVAAGRPGSIIAVSSILAQRVAAQVLPYAVSKAGLEHMVRTLALEWARHGIRVNALAPGYVETPLNHSFFQSEAGKAVQRRIPSRRIGKAEDLLGALLLLASDASAHMTGTTLVVDGGHLQSAL